MNVIVGYDDDNKPITEAVTTTMYSNFVRKTINYGDYIVDENGDFVTDTNGNRIQAETGYTLFDNQGRQYQSFNEEGSLVQQYNYSSQGFLKSTYSYGKDKALTGSTIFDNYSRPVASFNSVGRINNIPEELLAALSDGLDAEDLANSDWQPYLKGLSQTFEYGDNGLLATSKSWGEAVAIDVTTLEKFAGAFDSVKGDENYTIEFDYNEDGEINQLDMDMLNDKFDGAENMVNQYINGTIEKADLRAFSKNFESRVYYLPTQTGYTVYDKYGKASEVYNKMDEPITDTQGNVIQEGILQQKYIYNERGFLVKSESYGINMDEYGNIQMNGDVPEALLTGYTLFDAASKPYETYAVYHKMDIDDQGNVTADYGEVHTKVQEYVYDDGGFLVQTLNFGKNGVYTGYTQFDKYGRQLYAYNEFDS